MQLCRFVFKNIESCPIGKTKSSQIHKSSCVCVRKSNLGGRARETQNGEADRGSVEFEGGVKGKGAGEGGEGFPFSSGQLVYTM